MSIYNITIATTILTKAGQQGMKVLCSLGAGGGIIEFEGNGKLFLSIKLF